MRAGVALRPETPVSVVMPLLKPRRLLDCVDVLAVQPGFGGQVFDSGVLAKVEELRSCCPELDIQVQHSTPTRAVCFANFPLIALFFFFFSRLCGSCPFLSRPMKAVSFQ